MRELGKMMKIGICALFVAMMITGTVWAAKKDTTCATKYPLILAHGMGFEASDAYPNSFPGIVEALEACGAVVYTPSVAALGTTADKAAQFVEAFEKGQNDKDGNFIPAILDAEVKRREALGEVNVDRENLKFHIIGHSHGCLYTRYAICQLGMDNHVVTHTSIAGPHRGSPMADLMVNLADNAPRIAEMILGSMPLGGDTDQLLPNQIDLMESTMKTFNTEICPNDPNIYYQSWTGQYRRYNVFGMMSDMFEMLGQATGDQEGTELDAEAMMAELYNSLPMLATEMYLLGGGPNDGLVPVESAKWGDEETFEVVKGPWWSNGVNHLDVVNLRPDGSGGGFDPIDKWVEMVKGLKARDENE